MGKTPLDQPWYACEWAGGLFNVALHGWRGCAVGTVVCWFTFPAELFFLFLLGLLFCFVFRGVAVAFVRESSVSCLC